MKKSLFIFILMFINFFCFPFSEDYFFHGKDKKNLLKTISINIEEKNNECITGFYTEEYFITKEKLHIAFEAIKNTDGKFYFEVNKDENCKLIKFTYDNNYLYLESTVIKINKNNPIFKNFNCTLTSLTNLKKNSVNYGMLPLNNQNINKMFYKSQNELKKTSLNKTIPKLKIENKIVKFDKNTQWYEITLNYHKFIYTFYNPINLNYTAYFIIFDITNQNDIKTYTLQTYSFDTTPLIIQTTDSQLIFLCTKINTNTDIQSDFITKPYILTENGLKLLKCPKDYLYFNLSYTSHKMFEIVKEMNYLKNIIIENGFSVTSNIINEGTYTDENNKILNYFICIQDSESKELKLIVYQKGKLIGYYAIPSIPEFSNNKIIFKKENQKNKVEEESITLSKDFPSTLIIFQNEFKLFKMN